MNKVFQIIIITLCFTPYYLIILSLLFDKDIMKIGPALCLCALTFLHGFLIYISKEL